MKKRIKKMISRTSGKVSNAGKSITSFIKNSLQKEKSPIKTLSLKPDFSLEEEAAKLAYRYGWTPLNRSNQEDGSVVSEIDDSVTEILSERERIDNGREILIAKFEKNIGIDEKDGWEAFYS